jgi:hypothetical protein
LHGVILLIGAGERERVAVSLMLSPAMNPAAVAAQHFFAATAACAELKLLKLR